MIWPSKKNKEAIQKHAFEIFLKGLACFGSKDREQALKHLRDAIAIKPDEGIFHLRIAATLEALGKSDEAITEYEEAIRLMPGNGEPFFLLGNMLRDQDKVIDASNNYEKALSLSLEPPFDALCKKALGSLQQKIEMMDARSPLEKDLIEIRNELLMLDKLINDKLGSYPRGAIMNQRYSLNSPIDKELQNFIKDHVINTYNHAISELIKLLSKNNIIIELKQMTYNPEQINALQYNLAKINKIRTNIAFVILPNIDNVLEKQER